IHLYLASQAVHEFAGNVAPSSPGWLVFGGWPFIVGSVRSVTALLAFPLWVSAVIVPLSLTGWIFNHHEVSGRIPFAILGFVLPFMFIGRPDNDYWAILYAALLVPGLAFSIPALNMLIRSAFSRGNRPKAPS